MGFFNKITKIIREVTKPIERVGKEAGKAVGAVAGALSGGQQPVEQAPPPAPVVQAPPPATQVEVPEQEKAEGEDEAQTESARKKARAGGKKSLSVARSSGGGINI